MPPPPAPQVPRPQRAAPGPSYILQHYHATGCAGGAFSWRGAMLDPAKAPIVCTEPREYRRTTSEDIARSKEDKRRGGGPRVGPFQACIPGDSWHALPKYDFTSRNRSSAFNERMHVEWENHVDHILANGGELPTASVVAKAGFRSCAPCCRDMLALARPTGKAFVMVDLAEDDTRGTFHFVAGDRYLPVPKEACSAMEVSALKELVTKAQEGAYATSQELYDAVVDLQLPIDEEAQAFYLADPALLPPGCATGLRGQALVRVLHAEHFARLPAEYGASILRDSAQPEAQRAAVRRCRALAEQMLVAAWRPHVDEAKVDLAAYAAAAVAPLLPEEPTAYARLRRSLRAPPRAAPPRALQAIGEDVPRTTWECPVKPVAKRSVWKPRAKAGGEEDDSASTAVPDEAASCCSDPDSQEDAEA